MRFIDLTGQRFGRLVVLSRGPNNKTNHVMWRCRCDCGKEIMVFSGVLRKSVRSCGCAAAEKARTRLRSGEYVAMSAEEKQEHKRMLQRRWRHNHPEWVKTSNKKWSEYYKETEPFKCICKKCGCEFYKSRTSYKICSECHAKIHAHAETIRKEKLAKKEARKVLIATIIQLHCLGLSQTEIAQKLGRTQSGISALLRRHGIKKLTRQK